MIKDKKKILKALNVINNNYIRIPREFSEKYFQGELCLEKSSNIGRNGATSGIGAWMVAGRILNDLRKQKLIIKYERYELTFEGEKLLKEIEDGN